MAHFLNVNELAEACNSLGLKEEEKALVASAAVAGKAIAAKLGIRVTRRASNEPGFAGLCVGFGPAKAGQECPAEIDVYDAGSTWAKGE